MNSNSYSILHVQRERKLFHEVSSLLKHAFTVLVILTGLLFSADSVRAELVDMIAAKVNDKIILLSDVIIRLKQTLGAEKLEGLEEKARKDLEKRVLDQIVEEKILAAYALKLGINVDETLIDKNIEAIKKSNSMANWQLEEALKKEGVTMEEYHNIIKEQRLISLVINREVSSQIFVDDEELKNYYDNNTENFTTGEEIHVRHIFIKKPAENSPKEDEKAKARIKDILERLKKGEEFTRLAKLYSEDTTASAGGDLGFFIRGKMVPDFENAAFGLKPGEISGIVTTGFGYHIVKCVEKKDKRVLTFEEAKEEVRNRLYADKTKAKKSRLLEKIKRDVTVEMIM